MAHITGLSLGNFKVFKETTHFEFAPITILTGGNNVGKSSVLKALLLIADNAKKTQFLELDFSGDKHNLDTFDYTINKRADDDVIEIGFELSKFEYLKVSSKHHGKQNEFKNLLFNKYKKNSVKLIYNKSFLKNYSIYSDSLKIFEINYNTEVGHKVFINYKWLAKETIRDEYFYINTIKINQLFNNIPKSEQKDLELFISNELLEYISNITLDESQWYKWIAFKESNYSFRNLNDSDSIKMFLDFEEKWIELKDGFIENYKKEENHPYNLFEDANYYSIITLFTIATYSHEVNRLEKTANILLKNTIYEKYADLLKNTTIKDLLNNFIETGNILEYFEYFLGNIHKSIADKISLNYISSFRANSTRLYSNSNEGTEFNQLLLDIHKTTFSKNSQQFIQDWLKAFGIGDDIHFTWFKGVATEVKIEKNGELIDLVDLGFGFTQIIPIILKIALITNNHNFYNAQKDINQYIQKNRFIRNSDGSIKIKNLSNDYDEILEDDEQFKNKTYKRNELFDYHVVLLEEPETNLHPNFQSKLADFLLDASKRFNIQFIIETHSEYLIRRLQYLVATKETYPKDIALYYFNDPENIPQGEEQVKKIEFLENGNLSDNFGLGFFDEADNLAIDLFNLNRKRSRAKV
jgi:predicted ATPase